MKNRTRKRVVKRRRNPLRIDPTRTTTLRRAFAAKLRRAFAILKGRIVRLVVDEDAFGLRRTVPFTLAANCHPGQLRDASGKCGPGIGISIPREQMPQIRGDDIRSFIRFLRKRGISVVSATFKADDLSPTQKEFRQERVDAIPDSALTSPLLISRDLYILDGTHRWVKAWQKSSEAQVPVLQIDAPLEMALYLMKAFPKASFAANERFAGVPDPQKIELFQTWLKEQFDDVLIGTDSEELWRRYIEQGFRKGAGRSFDDFKASDKALAAVEQEKLNFFNGTREEFLRSSFAQPESISKVKLLAGRSFDDLENVTADMSTRMSRTLTDGLVQGQSPLEIARTLNDDLGIGRNRAELIARTELIRAHAEGQLTALEDLGVSEIGVAVEWSTIDPDMPEKEGGPCRKCRVMEGAVFKIDEARGMIPRHPNCRCVFIPANVGEDDAGQKRTKSAIDDAAEESGLELDIDVSRPVSIFNRQADGTDEEEYLFHRGQQEDGVAHNADLIAYSRLLDNVFCPTGPGGGVDPTCSPGSTGSARVVKADINAQRDKANFSGVEQEVRHSHSAWRHGLSDGNEKTLRDYSVSNYTSINRALRRGLSAPHIQSQVDAIDSAIAKSPGLPRPVTLYRGVSGAFADSLQAGKIVTDAAYQSTSLRRSRTTDGHDIELRISAPRGMKGAYLGGNESEFLLPRGTSLKVVAEEEVSGKRVVHAFAISPENRPASQID